MKKQTLVMESKPNNLSTFNCLMLLGHMLHEKEWKKL